MNNMNRSSSSRIANNNNKLEASQKLQRRVYFTLMQMKCVKKKAKQMNGCCMG